MASDSDIADMIAGSLVGQYMVWRHRPGSERPNGIAAREAVTIVKVVATRPEYDPYPYEVVDINEHQFPAYEDELTP